MNGHREYDVRAEDTLTCREPYCALDVPYERDGQERIHVAYVCPRCSRHDLDAARLLALFDAFGGHVSPANTDLIGHYAHLFDTAVQRGGSSRRRWRLGLPMNPAADPTTE